MLIEKLKKPPLGSLGLFPLESVPRAFQRLQLGFNACGLEPFVQPYSLLIGDIFVFRPMNRKNGSGAWTHPIQRTGLDVRRPLVLQVAAEKQRQHLRSVDALAVRLGEIGWAIVVHDTSNPAGLLGMRPAAFKLGNSARESEKQ